MQVSHFPIVVIGLALMVPGGDCSWGDLSADTARAAAPESTQTATTEEANEVAIGPTATAAPTPTQGTPTPVPNYPWELGSRYCPMAHCNTRMSDALLTNVPTGQVGILWHDVIAAGSNYGLGCSSNGSMIACTMGGNNKPGPFLKVYDAHGMVMWSSMLLNTSAFTSAPLIDRHGSVIAADSKVLIRFDPYGNVVWATQTAGGTPISPVITQSDTIVLATHGGPVSIYDLETGAMLDSLYIQEEWAGANGHYSTRNTPAMKDNRIYVSTEFETQKGSKFNQPIETRPARLMAIDIDRDARKGKRIKVAWYFEFGARSGSSPVRIGDTIYFDGDRLYPNGPFEPHVFAVQDLGTEPGLKWIARLDDQGLASAGQDPRGGIWTFGYETTDLVRLAPDDGRELQRVNVDALIGAPGVHGPMSAMSMGVGPRGQPVLITTAAELRSKESWLFAMDVETEKLLWKVRYARNATGWGAGQYPISIKQDGKPVVVFTTAAQGIYAVGRLPGSQ